MQGYDVNMKI